MFVGDVNDNSPVCPTLSEIQLESSVGIDYTVLQQLAVTDADINENALIQYLEVQDDSGNVNVLLDVDRQSGRIFTIG